MPQAMETVDFALAAAAATGFQQFANGTNQSNAIRATNGTTQAHLLDLGAYTTTQAVVTMRSPRLHDATQGILLETRGAEADVMWPLGAVQTLYSQDALTVGANFIVAPAANAIQHITAQVYYDDLPGVAASLRHWTEVQPNIIEFVGIQVSPTTAASPSSWGAGVAINSTYDLLKANQLYAILGFVCPAAVVALAIQGPDTGNLLCGGPNSTAPDDTRWYFKRLWEETGYATIPVINSANKAGTNVLLTGSVAATQYPVTLIAARLSA